MSFYDQASLQDILAQGQGGMGMAQAAQSIPPSPYNQMAQADPGFVNRITQRMQSLIEPPEDPRSQQIPDQAYGRASSHERGNQGIPDDETSAWETATAILKTPFALLNTVRDGLQDTLGFGGAQYRQAQRDNVEALQNLPQRQREALGIDRISGIQTPGMAAGETSGTAGAPSSLGSNAGSTMKGYVEWANNMGRDRAQQTMNQVRATINAQYAAGKMTKLELENLNEMLSGVRTSADTNRINAVTQGQNIENEWKPRLFNADLGVKNSAMGANNAQAGMYNANRQTEDEMRAARVAEQENKAWKANADARGVESNIFYMAGKDQATIDKTRQEIKRDETLLPYDVRSKVANTNADIALANQRAGVYGASGSGNTGENSATANLAKTDLEQRKALAELTLGNGPKGRPAMEHDEAYELFGVPKKHNQGWTNPLTGGEWFGSDTYDTRSWDPTAGAREALKGADTRAAATAIPLLPMPGVDQSSSPSAVRPSGDAIYAIAQILRKANPAGNGGDQVARAQEIAKIYDSLDRSNPDAFVASAKRANLSNDEIRALWQSSQSQ